jgi:hypothetical protein
MATVSEVRTDQPKPLHGRKYDRFFFSGIVLLILVIVVAGFARSYYLAGLFGAHLPSRLIHMHGAVFSAWILLLVVQTCCGGVCNAETRCFGAQAVHRDGDTRADRRGSFSSASTFLGRQITHDFLAVDSFIPLIAIYDLWSVRRIQSAMLWGGALQQLTLPIGATAAWPSFASSLWLLDGAYTGGVRFRPIFFRYHSDLSSPKQGRKTCREEV